MQSIFTKQFFGIIKNLYNKKQVIDLISIKEKAKTLGEDSEKIFKYMINLSDLYYTSASIESYIQKLKAYTTKREIIKKTKDIQDYIYTLESETDSAEIKKESIKKIADIEITKTNTEKEEMKHVILESMQAIEDRYNKRNDNTYKTGFWDLDKITDGLHEQEFTIIAARPRVWKNSVCIEYSRTKKKKRSTNILC